MVHSPVGFDVWLTAMSRWFTVVIRPIRKRFQGQDDDEEALRRRIVQAARVGYELRPDSGRAVDRRRVAVERVQVHGVVHVPRETADDVGGGVVGSTDCPEVLKTLSTSLTASTT